VQFFKKSQESRLKSQESRVKTQQEEEEEEESSRVNQEDSTNQEEEDCSRLNKSLQLQARVLCRLQCVEPLDL
jgi:hypothetical protein